MNLDIRPLAHDDIPAIIRDFAPRDPDKSAERWARVLEANRTGLRVTLVAWLEGKAVGVASVIWVSNYPPFAEAGIPEINSMSVVEPLRGRGIGSAIVRACEHVAIERGCPVMGIGVGLTESYARAQRLYPHLGYEFDEHGVFTNDWGSARYLTKRLAPAAPQPTPP
ncbi:MAG: hypothetical protein BIFFINMI_02972 [Phycisphaerae bacterium]|nr:hypothetical protein [Phycisphaerae bacterium]